MEWGNPDARYAAWLIPLVIGVGWIAHATRQRARARLVERGMQQRVMPSRSSVRALVKLMLFAAAIGCLVAAVARPRYGERFETVQTEGIDVFILLDVSRSMLAEDVAPNRLERAKLDILDLLPRLEGDRVGLIAFSGAPVLIVPLTADLGFFRLSLEQVDTDSAPRGGSLIGDTIRKGMAAMPREAGRDRVMILITDGEDQESFPREAAAAAGQENIPVITVGLGDPTEGARIPVRDESGGLSYVQYEGQEVWSRMDEELLRDIAVGSGGAYIPAGTRAYDLGQVYDDHLESLTRGALESRRRLIYRERFQGFVLAGLILLALIQLIADVSRSPIVGLEGDKG